MTESYVKFKKWLDRSTKPLSGRTVAITGSTGGLGKELCEYLAYLGASLVLVNRSVPRSEAQREELLAKFPGISVKIITADLEDMDSVRLSADRLAEEGIDIFIHNAGAYNIPRKTCSTGYDNVFQINFVSPYYILKRLLPVLRKRGGRAVMVGSIAHNYSKVDPLDIDFSSVKAASRVYGNAKRYLMYSVAELFCGETEATAAIAHPGITFTNITSHYPKLIFAIIKHPMKVIFMKPRRAALSILKAVFEPCARDEWIGPRIFGIWGLPKRSPLKTASEEERLFISRMAERIYGELDAKKD